MFISPPAKKSNRESALVYSGVKQSMMLVDGSGQYSLVLCSAEQVIALQVEREIKLHSRVQHESIISLYAAFQDAEGIYLVLVHPALYTSHPLTLFVTVRYIWHFWRLTLDVMAALEWS